MGDESASLGALFSIAMVDDDANAFAVAANGGGSHVAQVRAAVGIASAMAEVAPVQAA